MGDGHPYKVEGIGGDKIPSTLWFDYIDEFRQLADRDAFAMTRRLAREEGILGGGSSGLNIALACQVGRELNDPNALIVTLICDRGERYLSKVFNDEWMRENQMMDLPRPTVADLLARREAGAPALVSLAPSAMVRQALNLMSTYEVSQIPVMDGDHCVGGLTEATLMTRALDQPALLDHPVREVMDPPFPVVEVSQTTDRLAAMLTRESPAALVESKGKIVGIVSRYDVLRHMISTR
jgi:cystathionine beta-synthase